MYEVDEKCRKCRYNQTATCNRCDMHYDEFEPIEEPPITNGDRIRSMSKEAADAIEGLICEVADEHNARLDAESRQRWIPVTEQLIHSGWYLVACNEWGGSAVRKAIYDEATRKWLEFPCGGPKNITKFVTHYMPLPEPPKEEEA